LPGIGPAKAAAIVDHREQHGPFRVPGDLREVPGIGERTFQQLAELVTVS
jgi:competence protein ComEA